MDSKHSKMGSCNSPDHLDRDNGECPYSDLDSVPKILCPKALERQRKLVSAQPSVTVIKEVKKQPEVQSGLWFSKSGKERRPKTISPLPDRTLFSKVPCKKKNSSVGSKKAPVSGASSSSAGAADQSELLDKNKTAEKVLPPEQSGHGHLKCKSTPAANKTFGASGSPTDQAVLSDKQDSSVSVNPGVTTDKWDYLKGRLSNTADTVTAAVTDQLSSPDSKKSPEPSFKDQPSFSEIAKRVHQTEESNASGNRKSKSKGKDSDKTPVASFNVNTTALEIQKSLVSQCRLPFVKLIRKDLKGKTVNSSVTVSRSDQAECTKKEKTPDSNVTKLPLKPSDCKENSASVSRDQVAGSESIKVSVKKLKASGETGILRLSSEPSQEKPVLASSVDSVSAESVGPGSERSSPNENVNSSSNRSDQSESKRVSTSDNVETSSSGSSEQKSATAPSLSTAAVSAHRQKSSVCRNVQAPKGPASEKSQKAALKSKRVPEKLNKDRLPQQQAHLPASSRLMTRAFKAMQEAEKKKLEKVQKEDKPKESLNSLGKSTWKPEAKQKCCTKVKSLESRCTDNGECDQDTFSSSHSTPSLSDSSDLEVKSEDEDLSISSTPPMDFIPLTSKVKAKKEDHVSDLRTSSSTPSPFSFMNAFKNVKEVSFQSLASEVNGKPVSFKAEPNYKFSTFLMMLKDLHDTREREGTPLELEIGPPSAHVKDEPLMMPGEAKASGKDQQIEHIGDGSSPEKLHIIQNEDGTFQTSKRPSGRRGNSTGVRKKANHKVPCRPARSGPGYPGLYSLPAADPSSGAESIVQSLTGIPMSTWERPKVGGRGVAGSEEQEERWSRVNENLQNMVPLEQRVCRTTPCMDLPNGPIGDCTKKNTRLMQNVEDSDKTPAGENGRVLPN